MTEKFIFNMDKAYKNFFKKIKLGEKKGFPKFKSKHDSRQNYQSSTSFIKNNHLYLPKIGLLKAIFHSENFDTSLVFICLDCLNP